MTLPRDDTARRAEIAKRVAERATERILTIRHWSGMVVEVWGPPRGTEQPDGLRSVLGDLGEEEGG